LPDSYHDELINVINSQAAQATTELSTVLNGRTFPDGTNCLTSLHTKGYLKKIPVSNITMTPLPGQFVPLALINASIDKKMDEYRRDEAEKIVTDKEVELEVLKTDSDPIAIAHGLLIEADMLEKTAVAKRIEAFTLAPSLKPSPGRPAMSEEDRLIKAEERKDKRRIREQSKNTPEIKSEKLAQKQADVLDQKIQDKMKRDAKRKAPVEVEDI